MCPEMLNMRSTLAEEAGTPKNFFARGASKGKVISLDFKKDSGHLYL
jgi:hypothetical protein